MSVDKFSAYQTAAIELLGDLANTETSQGLVSPLATFCRDNMLIIPGIPIWV